MVANQRKTQLDSLVDRGSPICYGILKPGEDCPTGIPVIKVKNIQGGGVSQDKLLRTTPEIHEKYRRSEVKEGDLLLTIRGTIGRVAIVPKSLDGANITQDTVRIRVSSEDDPLYVFYALQCPQVQRKIELNTVGQAVKGINVAEVRKLEVFHPSGAEQKNIVQILSVWDKAITATERLLFNSHEQKEALIQQLLTGNRRLSREDKKFGLKKTTFGYIPADWEYPKIDVICSQLLEKNISGADYPVLSCSKHAGFVDSLKYFKKRVYSEDTSGYRVIPKDCFGFPANHIEEGSIGLQKIYEIGLVSPIYVVFVADQEKVNNDYLYALLKTEHYRQVFSAATNSSVDRRGSLRWKEFSSIHVPLPPLKEQNEIAAVIAIADKEIEALKSKLKCIKEEKNALMQQLLTGNLRVKMNGVAQNTQEISEI